MITGRRATDWLAGPSASEEATDDRRGHDRRNVDRRAPRRSFDPLFAASLVNQIAPAEELIETPYALTPPQVRRGVVINLRA